MSVRVGYSTLKSVLFTCSNINDGVFDYSEHTCPTRESQGKRAIHKGKEKVQHRQAQRINQAAATSMHARTRAPCACADADSLCTCACMSLSSSWRHKGAGIFNHQPSPSSCSTHQYSVHTTIPLEAARLKDAIMMPLLHLRSRIRSRNTSTHALSIASSLKHPDATSPQATFHILATGILAHLALLSLLVTSPMLRTGMDSTRKAIAAGADNANTYSIITVHNQMLPGRTRLSSLTDC